MDAEMDAAFMIWTTLMEQLCDGVSDDGNLVDDDLADVIFNLANNHGWRAAAVHTLVLALVGDTEETIKGVYVRGDGSDGGEIGVLVGAAITAIGTRDQAGFMALMNNLSVADAGQLIIELAKCAVGRLRVIHHRFNSN